MTASLVFLYSSVSLAEGKTSGRSSMAYCSSLVVSISSLFIVFLVISLSRPAEAGQFDWAPSKTCQGVAECLYEQDEFMMDSEINRRVLATSDYISYNALQRNRVPCSKKGSSYYNCQAGATANPYNRGCSTITQCRSWWIAFMFCYCSNGRIPSQEIWEIVALSFISICLNVNIG